MPDSVYKPLDSDSLETRFVRILPSLDFSATVECTLRNVSLNRGEPHVALSYAWGDPGSTVPILLDGVEYQVTNNLEAALRQLRAEDDGHSQFWIDAICIDQSNLSERNHQVRM